MTAVTPSSPNLPTASRSSFTARWVIPQAWAQRHRPALQHAFQKAFLLLEMLRPEEHAFRPKPLAEMTSSMPVRPNPAHPNAADTTPCPAKANKAGPAAWDWLRRTGRLAVDRERRRAASGLHEPDAALRLPELEDRMTDGKPGGLGLFRPQRSVPAETGSLTRRALLQRPCADRPRALSRFRLGPLHAPQLRGPRGAAGRGLPSLRRADRRAGSPAEARFAVRSASDRPLVEAYLATGAMEGLPSPSADRRAESGADKGAKKTRARPTAWRPGRASQIASLALGAIVGTRSNEPFIVANFLKSADIVQALDGDGWLRSRFRAGDPDWLHRLPADALGGGASAPLALLGHGGDRHQHRADRAGRFAFTPEDALAIAERRPPVRGAGQPAGRARPPRPPGRRRGSRRRAEHRYLTAEAAMCTGCGPTPA